MHGGAVTREEEADVLAPRLLRRMPAAHPEVGVRAVRHRGRAAQQRGVHDVRGALAGPPAVPQRVRALEVVRQPDAVPHARARREHAAAVVPRAQPHVVGPLRRVPVRPPPPDVPQQVGVVVSERLHVGGRRGHDEQVGARGVGREGRRVAQQGGDEVKKVLFNTSF